MQNDESIICLSGQYLPLAHRGRHFSRAGGARKIGSKNFGRFGWNRRLAPDSRTIAAARQRGYDLSVLRARQVSARDFAEFDYVLAMDKSNLMNLQRMKPSTYTGHLGLFLEFGSRGDYREVPDPYHGDRDDFELVLDLVEDAAQGLLNHICNNALR
jgi:protein-tyrosine phosphatase